MLRKTSFQLSYKDFDNKNYAKAIAHFTKALKKLPTEADRIYYHRGIAYLELGQNKKAVADLSQVVSKGYEKTYYYLGRAYFNLRKYDDAIYYLERQVGTIGNKPTIEAYMLLAKSYFIQKNNEQACKNFIHVLLLDPQNQEAREYLERIPDTLVTSIINQLNSFDKEYIQKCIAIPKTEEVSLSSSSSRTTSTTTAIYQGLGTSPSSIVTPPPPAIMPKTLSDNSEKTQLLINTNRKDFVKTDQLQNQDDDECCYNPCLVM